MNFEPQPTGGLHFERVIFKGDFVSLLQPQNLDKLLTTFSATEGFIPSNIPAYRTVIRAFYAGVQFARDSVPGGLQPAMDIIFIGKFSFRERQELTNPAYSLDHKKFVCLKNSLFRTETYQLIL